MWKYFLFISVLIFGSLGCSEYSKVLKKGTPNQKFDKAIEYYEKGECYKALPLFEELISLVRGTERAEKVYYYYAKNQYCLEDYYLANYYFKNFVKTYPYSQYSEECLFMAAFCSYSLSPVHTLDQSDTRSAIDEFQLFMNRFPQSELRDSCNHMISELRGKLEHKSFAVSKQYAKTGKHKAAVISLDHTLNEFPDSKYKEEILYLKVKSGYQLALNSVAEKKIDRFDETLETCSTFVRLFPKSKWLKDVDLYIEKCIKEKEKLLNVQ